MIQFYCRFSIIFLLAGILLLGCKGENSATQVSDTTATDILGTWKVVKAFKGNAPSRLLDNGKLTFKEDGTFNTNILSDPQYYPYSLNKNEIKLADSNKSKYSVVSVTTDTLILQSRIQNINFKFITAKE